MQGVTSCLRSFFSTKQKKVILIFLGLLLINIINRIFFNDYSNLTETMDLHLVKERNMVDNLVSIKNLKAVRKQYKIKWFKANHRRIVETFQPVKFVYIGRNGAGYGNKMLSLFTGFMVGLVTESAILGMLFKLQIQSLCSYLVICV